MFLSFIKCFVYLYRIYFFLIENIAKHNIPESDLLKIESDDFYFTINDVVYHLVNEKLNVESIKLIRLLSILQYIKINHNSYGKSTYFTFNFVI